MAKSEAKTSAETLTDFNFDDDSTFFGVTSSETKDDDGEGVVKEIQADDDDIEYEEGGEENVTKVDAKKDSKKTKVKAEEEDEDEEEEDVKFFQGDEDEPDGDAEDKIKKKDEDKGSKAGTKISKEGKDSKDDKKGDDGEEVDDKTFFTTLAKEMKEKNIFRSLDLKEDEEIDEEKFLELQDEELEARVEETFEEMFEEINNDEDAVAFLKFKRSGGRTADFFRTYGKNAEIDLTDFDVDDERSRDNVIRHYLATVDKMTGEELEDRFRWIKDGGKEKEKAEKYFTVLQKKDKEEKQALLNAQKKAAQDREDQIEALNNTLAKILDKPSTVGVFPLTESDKALQAYITKATLKVDKHKYVPQFNADLAAILNPRTEEDYRKLLVIAKLVRSNFEGKDLITKKRTEETKQVQSKLRQAKESTDRAKTSGAYSKRALSDFFQE